LKEAAVNSSGATEAVELVMGTGHDVFIPLQTNGKIVLASV
jgi:hypothetical protein